MAIFAIDIEDLNIWDNFYTKIGNILKDCLTSNIPYIFSCTRRELGLALYGRKNI